MSTLIATLEKTQKLHAAKYYPCKIKCALNLFHLKTKLLSIISYIKFIWHQTHLKSIFVINFFPEYLELLPTSLKNHIIRFLLPRKWQVKNANNNTSNIGKDEKKVWKLFEITLNSTSSFLLQNWSININLN